MRIRLLGELRDFLAVVQRGYTLNYELTRRAAIKDIVEACGVPHTEIGGIRIDGRPATAAAVLDAGSRARVLVAPNPVGRAAPSLRPVLPAPPSFLLDTHLGRLARYLRLLGFDARYSNDCDDARLAEIAEADDRVLLTRDRGLLKRARVVHGRFVRDDDPQNQLDDVVAHFALAAHVAPFARCSDCNTRLAAVAKADIAHRLAPLTQRYYHRFGYCPNCDKLFWAGGHVQRLRERMARFTHPRPVR